MIIVMLFSLAISLLLVTIAWKWADRRADAAVWARLVAHQPSSPTLFEPSMILSLPAPAQRFFTFAIKPGTPLNTVAEISMEGKFSLGGKVKPSYMVMRAQQILAPPHGFIWQLDASDGAMRISGSDAAEDGKSWSRFWLLGFAPVARAGGNPDHFRSAFGRYVAETVFWTPAALLPGDNVRWQSIDESTVRVTLTHMELEQAVDLSVDAIGRLSKVVFQRWSDANSAKEYQLQPFGGYLADYKEFEGFRLPTTVEAGNCFETEKYFPFFKVAVTSIRFPAPNDD